MSKRLSDIDPVELAEARHVLDHEEMYFQREPKGTEYEEARGHPLEGDLLCNRESEVAVTIYPVYMQKMGLVPEEPAPESNEDSSWWCINDHTGCLWNDGNNTCSHPGESMSPLEEKENE
jgi:hypothetical protein